MDYQQLVATMTPDVYRRLQRALELGKWPNGELLTAPQRENAMQAVILWGERNLPQHERVGFVDKKEKEGDVCDTPQAPDPNQETPLNWKD